MSMTPTTKLRFVERDCYVKNGESFQQPFRQRILQQWWEKRSSFNLGWTGDVTISNVGEWRDISLEEENT